MLERYQPKRARSIDLDDLDNLSSDGLNSDASVSNSSDSSSSDSSSSSSDDVDSDDSSEDSDSGESNNSTTTANRAMVDPSSDSGNGPDVENEVILHNEYEQTNHTPLLNHNRGKD